MPRGPVFADRRASGQVAADPAWPDSAAGLPAAVGLAPARFTPGSRLDDPVSKLAEEFTAFLVGERGLAPGTIRYYRDHARRFLAAHAAREGGVAGLTAGDVSSFLLSESGRRGSGSLQNVVTALRALLRFLHVRGPPVPLAGAPRPPSRAGAVRRWHGRCAPADVTRLLDSCDRATAAGRRDYAALMLLARLGCALASRGAADQRR
jgi:site-specific recombinase XerD